MTSDTTTPRSPAAETNWYADPMHEQFAAWALGYIGSDGADLGEVAAIAASMEGSDDGVFYDAWMAAARRHLDGGGTAADGGRSQTARHHFLRASVCAGVAYHPLYGRPVDPRLTSAFELQMDALGKALARLDPPAEALTIPFDGHELPAFFLPARGARSGERRPLVIGNNGYDATVSDLYFSMGAQTVERGYHCLIFDGPGQGGPLIRDGVTMVPDWERVIRSVVDAVIDRPDVDADRIALQGWSLGGYLALRGASGEHRLAACVADPPLEGLLGNLVAAASAMGVPADRAAKFPEISDADQQVLTAAIEASPQLRWSIIRRGYWVNGGTDLRSFMELIAPYNLVGRLERITCPVWGSAAEDDPLAGKAAELLGRIPSPTTLVRFTAAEGAGTHVELQNRALLETSVLDWLDDVLR